MKLEEAKKYIRMIIRQQEIPDSAKALGYVYASEAIETILQALDNSIPKEKVEDKIEIYKRLELESFNRDSIQADEYRAIIKVL